VPFAEVVINGLQISIIRPSVGWVPRLIHSLTTAVRSRTADRRTAELARPAGVPRSRSPRRRAGRLADTAPSSLRTRASGNPVDKFSFFISQQDLRILLRGYRRAIRKRRVGQHVAAVRLTAPLGSNSRSLHVVGN